MREGKAVLPPNTILETALPLNKGTKEYLLSSIQRTSFRRSGQQVNAKGLSFVSSAA